MGEGSVSPKGNMSRPARNFDLKIIIPLISANLSIQVWSMTYRPGGICSVLVLIDESPTLHDVVVLLSGIPALD